MKNIISLLIFAGFLNICYGEPLLEPPKGYSWQQLPLIKSHFLLPSEWYYKFNPQVKDDKYSFFITKENIEQMGFFETGFSLRVVKNVPLKMNGKRPSEYVDVAMKDAEKAVGIEKKWKNEKGIFKEQGLIYSDTPENKPKVKVYRRYISNDETGTLYMLTFEGPAAQWEENWKIGEPIMTNFSLDEKM